MGNALPNNTFQQKSASFIAERSRKWTLLKKKPEQTHLFKYIRNSAGATANYSIAHKRG